MQVGWTQEEEGAKKMLALRWIESGGPKVEPPSRRGFGRQLIERNITKNLGGTADIQFTPSGLKCLARVPL